MSLYGSLSCNITVLGDGNGRYGKPKTTKTGPLSDFLVDNSVFYVAITKHLKECDHCSIDAVLTEYLRRRRESVKFNGQSSSGLVKRAIILERLAKKRGQSLTPGIVNELIWRNGLYAVQEYGSRLSLREKFMAFTRTPVRSLIKLTEEDELLRRISHQINENSSEEEIEELLKIAEVITT